MKKLLMSAALALSCIPLAVGCSIANPEVLEKPASTINSIEQVTIDDLSFNMMIKAFYNSQMKSISVNDEDMKSLPHAGIGPEVDGEKTVALMHPVISYSNLNGDTRYLVMIEKVKVDAEYGALSDCHACNVTADFYSFKRLPDGRYQLVSKTLPESNIASSYGRARFDVDKFQAGLQPLGEGLIGSLYKTSGFIYGSSYENWTALYLPEDDYIRFHYVGDAGGYNDYGKDSPLDFMYKSTYEVISDNSKYYPIKLRFKGNKPINGDPRRLRPVNHTVIKKFDPLEEEFK
ncbi:hypothetical protein [Psychrobacter sp. S1-30-MNA-CIBAN-0213]|uniref:hypothetical protein n=1 Tax=unclassified Psychrobacter TaxID=196806 RepID=UPI0033302457